MEERLETFRNNSTPVTIVKKDGTNIERTKIKGYDELGIVVSNDTTVGNCSTDLIPWSSIDSIRLFHRF